MGFLSFGRILVAGQQSLAISEPSDTTCKTIIRKPVSRRTNQFNKWMRTSFACAFVFYLGCGSARQLLAAGGQATTTDAVTLPQVQASPADSFVDSMGVVTHITYGNTPYYTNWSQTLKFLQDLGIRHIRDGYFDPSWTPFATKHQQLAQSGIRTNYVIPYDPTISSQSIQQLASVSNDMELLEIPNECDLAGSCGVSWDSSMANMVSISPVVKSAGTAMNVPVLGPAFAAYETYGQVGNLSPLMNYNNLHVYFGGRNPGAEGWGAPDAQGNAYGTFKFWLDQANLDAPGLPSQITETGYMTFPGNPTPYTVPPDVEESYIPRTYALAYLNGIGRTYVYELLDEINSPGFGLVDGNMNPRPAYYAIRNLIGALADPGPSFTPGTLPYAITGDSTLRKLLFQKRDGSFLLLLWSEQSSYDTVHSLYTPVIPQQVTLSLGGTYYTPSVGTFDTSGNLNWTNTDTASQTVPFTISDQITIVKILPR
ncbi:hypothetical protein [Terriglobus albidus]|uniref:hypothetical protein n=1 Tax=Terriglobus albidus TaxID=1592106 RepID=UPI0021DFB4C4|nr:hypothetical protein [Terriglobus albidus]